MEMIIIILDEISIERTPFKISMLVWIIYITRTYVLLREQLCILAVLEAFSLVFTSRITMNRIGNLINSNPSIASYISLHVPLLDTINGLSSIPLGLHERQEYGDIDYDVYQQYLYSISPYHNIKKQKYPTMYITYCIHHTNIIDCIALQDTCVPYYIPLKYVQKIREQSPSTDIILQEAYIDWIVLVMRF